MHWLLLACAIVVLIFASAIIFGAPFLPTLRAQISTAMDLLDLSAGQTMLELGSGDGRILREAAKRGIYGIGYEINPLLVLYSRLVNWRYRKLVTVHWRNFWHVSLPACDGVYVFLLQPYMQKLQDKLERDFTQQVKVISFAFAFPKQKAQKEQHGVMLYRLGGSPKTIDKPR